MCKVRAEGRAWREAGESDRALSSRCLSGAEWLQCVWLGKAWSEALTKSTLAFETIPTAVGKDTIRGRSIFQIYFSLWSLYCFEFCEHDMSLSVMFDFLALLQHLLFPSGTCCPFHRVGVLLSVPGSVSCPLVWRGSLHPDHLKILGVEDGPY